MSDKKKQFWIVWNEARTEGFITDEYGDARQASSGRFYGAYSTLSHAFFEAYEEDNTFIEPVLLSREPKS